MECYPFGLKHRGYNNVVNGTDHKYGFGGKEEQDDSIDGNKLDWLDFGARNYDASLGRWMNLDPLAELYNTDSPYEYVLNNPLSFIDPDGRKVVGVTKDDASKAHEDLNTVFSGEQFDKLRGLFTRGKKNNKKAFDKIDDEALEEALSGLEGDDLELATIVTGAINSKPKHKVEFLNSSDNLSEGGNAAFNTNTEYAISLELGGETPSISGQNTGKSIISTGTDGLNVPVRNGSGEAIGSHSFLMNNSNCLKRATTTIHEVFGHGVPSSRGASITDNNANAIRTENLVNRVIGIQEQRTGVYHAGGAIQNPSALPKYK